MIEKVNESVKTVASYRISNTDTKLSKRIALFSGHYDTSEIVFNADDKAVLSYANPDGLVAAGYQCDQVADDVFLKEAVTRGDGASSYPCTITPQTQRTRYRDVINLVKLTGLKVTKLRITDLSNDSNHELFNQEIEVSRSCIASKGESDYINLSTYINPKNFQQNVIEIDLEEQQLSLDETTVVIMTLPANADFKIDLILA